MWKTKKEEIIKDKQNCQSLPRLHKKTPNHRPFHPNKTHQRSYTRPSESHPIIDQLQEKRINFILRNSECETRKQQSFKSFLHTSSIKNSNKSKMEKGKQIHVKKKFTKRDSMTINPFFHKFAKQNKLKEKTDQQMFEEYFQKKFTMKAMQNFCYDSPFIIPREGPCLVSANQKIYLIGGGVRRKIGYIGKQQKNIDIPFHCYQENHWVREKIVEQMPIQFRNIVWHTLNTVDDKIVIVGGMVGQSQKSMNSLNSELLVYCPLRKKLEHFPINLGLRFHASTSFGSHILIHGGQTSEGYFSNKTNIISMKDAKNPKIISFDSGIDLIFHKLANTLTLQKADQYTIGSKGGIFLFGGKNMKGQMSNTLKVIRSNCFEVERIFNSKFENTQVFGVSPCSRTHHTLDLLPKKLSLVLVGGLDCHEVPLADVWIFSILQSTWSQVQMEPSMQLRFGGIFKHSSIADNDNIYIYGGKHVIDQGIQNFMCLQLGKQVKDKKNCNKKTKEKQNSTLWSISFTNKDITDHLIQF